MAKNNGKGRDADGRNNTQNQGSATDGFDQYQETSVDPGIWLLLFTTLFCFFVMVVLMPLMVYCKRRRQTQSAPAMKEALNPESESPPSHESKEEEEEEDVEISLRSVVRMDTETNKILWLAGPFTLSALSTSMCANACLIMVSKYVGTKGAAAYAIVQVLVGLSDGVLRGPISALTAVCAHAVGAGNSSLAGEYVQLAILFYLFFQIPAIWFWYQYMYEVVLYLEWGDQTTAQLSQDYVRTFIYSTLFTNVSNSIWELLEITDHAVVCTICTIVWGLLDVVIIGLLVYVKATKGESLTLVDVANVNNATSFSFVIFTVVLAECRGWLKPFRDGLFKTFSLANLAAIKVLLKQALPLSFGYLLSNAEWAVLTLMASYLGPAEVAAWAILGSIWNVLYATTAGIGNAAEIRVAHHLGDNSPKIAELSAYKALYLGMAVACVSSALYFALQNDVPAWFTTDETLQHMLRELVPFVGVANLTMTFGYQCWSIIGAQGKYSTATWVNFFSSWGIGMPLAALFTYGYRIDLQGLTAASTVGYVFTGAILSYILLGSDWNLVARKIQERNDQASAGEASKTLDPEEILGSIRKISVKGAGSTPSRSDIRLLTVPAGTPSGIIVGTLEDRPGNFILKIMATSPFFGAVHVGNAVLAINGQDATHMDSTDLRNTIADRTADRVIAVLAPDIDEYDVQQSNVEATHSSVIFWNDGVTSYVAHHDEEEGGDKGSECDSTSSMRKIARHGLNRLRKKNAERRKRARRLRKTQSSIEIT